MSFRAYNFDSTIKRLPRGNSHHGATNVLKRSPGREPGLCSFVVMTQISAAPAVGFGEGPASFDPSQFKLQADGTFRISIRGMAAMAGVDDSALSRSLRSAAAENALPCARSLVAQGFDPAAVSTWGETGGIPEEAVPFVLEHYSNAANHAGNEANGRARRARLVLLSFARVGINAFLRDKLGIGSVSQVRDTQPVLTPEQQSLEWLLGLTQRWGMKLDDRDELQIKNHAMSLALNPAGGAQSIYNDAPISRLIYDLFRVVLENRQLAAIGRRVAAIFRQEFGEDPRQHDQYVDGACRSVAHYDREWLERVLRGMHDEDPSLFVRRK